MTTYLDNLAVWLTQTRADVAAHRPLAPVPDPQRSGIKLPSFQGGAAMRFPRALYDGMLAPLAPLALRGAIWYQGESNLGDGPRYLEKQRAVVEGWREEWQNPELYFAYVELAPHAYGDANNDRVPICRAVQREFLSVVPHTGMAVISDTVDHINDIHPRRKLEVGHRLALLARHDVYGQTAVSAYSPALKSAEADGAAVRLVFSHVGAGLKTTDGNPPTLFEVQGADEKWYPATAEIVGADSVVITAAAAPSARGFRFAWRNGAQPNLVNSDGLPASSLRGTLAP
jgi:sialate O-acetylesterase